MPDDPTTLPTSIEPMLLPVQAAAMLLGMSAKALRRADQAGKVPAPVRVGRNVRWRKAELVAWVNAGCPDRETWQVIQNGRWRRDAAG